MNDKKWKNKNFFEAFLHASKGIKYTFCNERNLRIQIFFAIIAIICSAFLELNSIEFAIIFIIIGAVLFAEMLNTILEEMLDLYTTEYNETVKNIKDIASGAVLVLSITAVFVGCSIWIPKIFEKW